MSHQTSEEIRAKFLLEMKALLEKYNAEISLELDFPTRYESPEHIEIYIPGIYDGEDTRDSATINFGNGVSKNTIDLI
jgi:hypothetical protein